MNLARIVAGVAILTMGLIAPLVWKFGLLAALVAIGYASVIAGIVLLGVWLVVSGVDP